MDLKFNHMELTIPNGQLTDEWIVDSDKHLSSPGMDHLGLLAKSSEHVLEMWDKVRGWKAKDERVETVDQYEFDTGRYLVTAFYVRFLLAIYFDVMHQAPKSS